MILLDTNILGRITDSTDQHCAASRRAIRVLPSSGEQLAIVPQNLYEFWAIATRTPAANGLGMTTNQARLWLGYFQRRFVLLPDHEDLVQRWHDLVKTHSIRGFRAYDARLVAAMLSYGLSNLLTFNGTDFKGLPVTVVDPVSV